MKPVGALLARLILYGAVLIGSAAVFDGRGSVAVAIAALVLLEATVLMRIDKVLGMPSVRDGMLRRLGLRS